MTSRGTARQLHVGNFPDINNSHLNMSGGTTSILDKWQMQANKIFSEDVSTVQQEVSAEELSRLRSLKDNLKQTNWMFDNSLGAYTSAGRR